MMMALAPSSPPVAVKLVGSRNQPTKHRTQALAVMKATAIAFPPAEKQVEAMRLATEDRWVVENMLPLLTPVEDAWQPAEFLPSFAASAEEQQAQVAELQARAADVPDDLLVCLVGNMVTEEGLPTYMTMANRVEAIHDSTGCDEHGWALWLRGWTAEENRHGDLLARYLYLCGRVDMRQVERTVHHLLRRGMRTTAPTSCYHAVVYGAFQERATFVSHARTARLAAVHGDACLAKLCGVVSADEKRHEVAYTRAAARIFEADADGMVRALADMMRAKITMPGEFMTDGRDDRLFDHFSAVAQRAGVYTAADYGDMVEHFVGKWGVADVGGGDLSGEGRRAQEYVCELPSKIRRMDERAHDRAAQKVPESVSFSWVFDRPVRIA